jgi:hypothetical protein
MPRRATGSFDVNLVPQPDAQSSIGRMSLDKRFQGDLYATSVGQTLAVRGSVEGSAAYVAMEHVTGSLHDRQGGFVLQHVGIMNRGDATLTVKVVPDSGTGALLGLSGSMKIIIADGKHFYELDYELPEGELPESA